MSLNTVLGANIRVLRKAARQSQADLGQKCLLARSYVNAIEQGKGNPSIEVIQRIAQALGVDPVILLLGSENQHPNALVEELARAPYEGYALTSWTEKGLRLHPIQPKDDLSVRVLQHLINEGFEGVELRRQYRLVLPEIRRFFEGDTGKD